MLTLIRRLQYVVRHRRVEAELAEEIENHRALTQQRLEQAGMPPRDAIDASRCALGNVTLAREDARGIWIWPWLESVGQDIRYAVRSLSRQPGFAVTAILTLGVGIGLNTTAATMFTTMYWRQWDVPNPGEVVQVMTRGFWPARTSEICCPRGRSRAAARLRFARRSVRAASA